MNKKKYKLITDYPLHLRGLPNNRWGGHRTNRLRALRGSKLGPANKGRTFTEAERMTWAKDHGYVSS